MKATRLLFLAVSIAFTGAASANVVGYWPMDEDYGPLVQDASGNWNLGDLVNYAGDARVQGISDRGLYFSGIYGPNCTRVQIFDSPTLRLLNGATFAAWVRCDDTGRDAPILAKEGPSQQLSYWFGVFGPAGRGSWGALLDQDGWQGWDFNGRSQGYIPEGEWVHLAFTWDGFAGTYWVNGVIQNYASWGGTIRQANARLFFGSNSEYTFLGNRTSFKGAIDEVRVANHAATPEEVAAWARIVRGSVVLGDYVGPVGGVAAVAKLYQDGILMETKRLTLGSAGDFAFHTDLTGEATIVLKASHWLSEAVGKVNLDAPETTLPAVLLTNGDIDGNNIIDSDDFDILIAQFGTVGPAADLTGNELVDSDDFDILVAHFGEVGD